MALGVRVAVDRGFHEDSPLEVATLDRMRVRTDLQRFPQLTELISLPTSARIHVECREPTRSKAEGVDADEVSEVEDFAAELRSVTDDHFFSR